jgi:2-oxoisovalerate dehydrogenase E1 component alpha subunit
VIENNRYATFSDQLKRQKRDNICQRVKPFGVRSTQIFGNDAPLAWRTLRAEMDRLRDGDGPALVEAYTYRWNSHVGPEDDGANNYRSAAEIQFWKDNCPLVLLGEALEAAGMLDAAAREQLERETADEISENFRFAKESPFPDDTNWHAMNHEDATPLADQLLGSASSAGAFDQNQAEARLGPY